MQDHLQYTLRVKTKCDKPNRLDDFVHETIQRAVHATYFREQTNAYAPFEIDEIELPTLDSIDDVLCAMGLLKKEDDTLKWGTRKPRTKLVYH